MPRLARLALVLGFALSARAAAQEPVRDLPGMDRGPDPDCAAANAEREPGARSVPAEPAREPGRRASAARERPRETVHRRAPSAPAGRAISALSSDACLAELEARGVRHEALPRGGADGVTIPIRIEGAISGIELGGTGWGVIDCRLAVAITAWAPVLHEAGIRRLRSVSIHRPGARVSGSGRMSGHASALAIDVGAVVLEDGAELRILNGWEARAPGVDPCGSFEEGPRSARLRGALCEAVRSDLFQIVLTPHHDRAHQNHLHLELVPGVSWSYVR